MRPARTRTQQTDSKADRRSGSHPGRRVALTAVIAAVGFFGRRWRDRGGGAGGRLHDRGGRDRLRTRRADDCSATAGQLLTRAARPTATRTRPLKRTAFRARSMSTSPPRRGRLDRAECGMAKAGQGRPGHGQPGAGARRQRQRRRHRPVLDAVGGRPAVRATTRIEQSPAVGYAGNDSSGAPDVYYYRPPHDSSDLDFLDELTPDGQPLTLKVFTGPQLAVTATASPPGRSIRARRSRSARTVTPTDAANPTYAWSFGPGAASATATGATVNATYEQPGTWSATVV